MARSKADSFNMVNEFHTLADQPVAGKGAAQIPDLRAVRFREHFKIEELIEGLEALTAKGSVTAQRTIDLLRQAQSKWMELQESDLDVDLVEYADSLGDLRYVTDGAAHYYNIDMNKVMPAIHTGNMTRFPRNEEELAATLQKAEEMGVEVDHHLSEEHGVYVVTRRDTGKVFKNAMHTLPDLTPILGVNG